jgi:hypothetical protein
LRSPKRSTPSQDDAPVRAGGGENSGENSRNFFSTSVVGLQAMMFKRDKQTGTGGRIEWQPSNVCPNTPSLDMQVQLMGENNQVTRSAKQQRTDNRLGHQ